MSGIALRPFSAADAAECGRICHDAFRSIAGRHNFPPDFPSVEIAAGLMSALAENPGFHGVVAEVDGRIVGSNFLDERDAVAGVGPITVDPSAQDGSIGRQLMAHVLARASERGFADVRLCQAAYHGRSLALYSKLGFRAEEPLSTMQGPALNLTIPGCSVRPAGAGDLEACNRLSEALTGHPRGQALADAVGMGTATLVEREGRITGYATELAFFGHAVGETCDDIAALIGAAPAFGGPGILVPTRLTPLLRWCLDHGLRIVQPLTLMSLGRYTAPRGFWLPSILY